MRLCTRIYVHAHAPPHTHIHTHTHKSIIHNCTSFNLVKSGDHTYLHILGKSHPFICGDIGFTKSQWDIFLYLHSLSGHVSGICHVTCLVVLVTELNGLIHDVGWLILAAIPSAERWYGGRQYPRTLHRSWVSTYSRKSFYSAFHKYIFLFSLVIQMDFTYHNSNVEALHFII